MEILVYIIGFIITYVLVGLLLKKCPIKSNSPEDDSMFCTICGIVWPLVLFFTVLIFIFLGLNYLAKICLDKTLKVLEKPQPTVEELEEMLAKRKNNETV